MFDASHEIVCGPVRNAASYRLADPFNVIVSEQEGSERVNSDVYMHIEFGGM